MRRSQMTKLAPILIAATFCAAPLGCGDGLDAEREERAYLSSLSDPTPRQRRRREHLEVATRARLLAQHARLVGVATERAEARRAEAAAAKAGQDPIDAAGRMAEAAARERDSESHLAMLYYREVISKYPGTSQAKQAAARIVAMGGR
jgi:hypothetical protein